MHTTPYTAAYADSTHAPVNDPKELKAWWARRLPNELLSPIIYQPYKVKVVKRQKNGQRDDLSFILVHDEQNRVFTVDIPTESNYVWPDLPSTAQWVIPGSTPPYAFLFLSPEWAEASGIDPDLFAEQLAPSPRLPPGIFHAGGGGKWPIAGPKKMFRSMLQAIPQADLRNKLLSAFAEIDQEAEDGSSRDE